ncbi:MULTISPECIES: ABC transporter substrate-binding protein [unclassified Janthinobacterium]|uniref:ABC transporter substrate-binding protein n=1 Tax=unclassified Janthinobacterium TaxID=2610881 RepID=UPI00034A2584|nr:MULTISPECIES: ABC transporter substrate-binding protein [unclassified Janthinobacterium]MEC5162791.1 NitT/TauT family transport system substrate-binding protein [Janthinobacterium sp. CG_S6]
MIKTLLATLSLPLLALAAAAPAAAQGAGKPIRIGWVHALANAPALIADKKGYFAEEGLKVELTSFGDGPVVQQALAAGELDIAYIGAPPVFQWYARGLNSRILAKVNYGQAALITNGNAGITSLAGLRGKKIAGVAKGSGMDVLLRGYVLKEAGGLDPERDVDVVSMPVGNMNAALERGLVDAAFTWEPFVSDALLRGKRVLLDVNQGIPRYPWYVVMAVPKTLAERPDDVVKVLRAHRKAIAFLNEHQEESNRIIADAFQIAPVKTAAGATVAPAAVVQQARKRLGWSDRLEPGDLRFIQRLMDYSLALGFLNKELKVSQVVDLSWQQRADQPRVKR